LQADAKALLKRLAQPLLELQPELARAKALQSEELPVEVVIA
jgi:hypothetical protein